MVLEKKLREQHPDPQAAGREGLIKPHLLTLSNLSLPGDRCAGCEPVGAILIQTIIITYYLIRSLLTTVYTKPHSCVLHFRVGYIMVCDRYIGRFI